MHIGIARLKADEKSEPDDLCYIYIGNNTKTLTLIFDDIIGSNTVLIDKSSFETNFSVVRGSTNVWKTHEK